MKTHQVNTHPLMELVAQNLFSIETVPPAEARKMVRRAAKAAMEWHEKEVEKMRDALKIHNKFNPIRNDLDAYLFELADYALGNNQKAPSQEDFGVEI